MLGYSLILFLCKKEEINLLESAAISFVLGSGFLTVLMTLFIALKIPLERSLIIIFLLIFIIISMLLNRKRLFFNFRLGWPKDWIFWVLIALVTLQVFFVFSESMLKPVYTWDAAGNWIQRAKIIFYERLPVNFFGNDYPLHVPLFSAWFSIVGGGWDDQVYKITYPLYFLCMLASFYFVLRRNKKPAHSIFFVFFLATLPLLAYHATISYADFTMAVFYYFTAACLYVGLLPLSLLFAGLMALVKTEGAFYLTGYLLVLGYYFWKKKKKKKDFFGSLGVLFAIILPWVLCRIIYRPPSGNKIIPDVPYTLDVIAGRFGFILQTFYNKLLFEGNWNLAWFALLIVSLIFIRRIFGTDLKYLYLLLFSAVLSIFMVFLFTEMYVWLSGASVTFNRTALHFVPIVVLCVGLAVETEKTP